MFELEKEKLNKLPNHIYILITKDCNPELQHFASAFCSIEDTGCCNSKAAQMKEWGRLGHYFLGVENCSGVYGIRKKLKKLLFKLEPMNFTVQYYHEKEIGRRCSGCTIEKGKNYILKFNKE